MQWNRVDYWFESYLRYLLIGTPAAEAIIEQMGNDSRAKIARQIVSEQRKGDQFTKYQIAVLDALNICRINRNFVTHGNIIEISDKAIIIKRLTKNIEKRKTYWIEIDTLKQVESELIDLSGHMRYCVGVTQATCIGSVYRDLPSLPDKWPEPRSLEGALQPILEDDPLPPQSSEA
jgi:hypothetical protein